uniref:Decapping nuclease n=1 Tax=Tetranychus urticae TaxID=32264 RepID=T1KED9_TETUR
MGRIRKDALDLEFLPVTSNVRFIGPERITSFSTYYNKEREEVYRSDNSSQRYLDATKLNIPINCLEGYNSESYVCDLPGIWEYFMHWIGKHEEIIRGPNPKNDPQQQIDFICTNLELKRILLACYEESDWTIIAFRIENEIFMHLADGETIEDNIRKLHGVEPTPQYNPRKTNKMNYARLNVIRKITKRVEERELNSDTDQDLFSIITSSKIGQHRILHTGITEFVADKDDVDKPIDQVNFAALKLIPYLFRGRNTGFNISFYRHLYWWASALVTGLETLICGDLDEDFTLSKLKVLPASILKTKYHATAQKKCLITLDKILHFIKSEVKEKNMAYEFQLNLSLQSGNYHMIFKNQQNLSHAMPNCQTTHYFLIDLQLLPSSVKNQNFNK